MAGTKAKNPKQTRNVMSGQKRNTFRFVTEAATVRSNHQRIQSLEQDVLALSIETGDIIAKVKTQLKHGEFTKWLALARIELRKAQIYMQLAKNQKVVRQSKTTTINGGLAAIRKNAPKAKSAKQLAAAANKAAKAAKGKGATGATGGTGTEAATSPTVAQRIEQVYRSLVALVTTPPDAAQLPVCASTLVLIEDGVKVVRTAWGLTAAKPANPQANRTGYAETLQYIPGVA